MTHERVPLHCNTAYPQLLQPLAVAVTMLVTMIVTMLVTEIVTMLVTEIMTMLVTEILNMLVTMIVSACAVICSRNVKRMYECKAILMSNMSSL